MVNMIYGPSIRQDVKNALALCDMTVTNRNVEKLYPELADGAYVIPSGEDSKTPDTLLKILAEMSARGLTRSSRIAALGGGVVGDITGLAAALYMRGIQWVNIPTTLLAMVDSGIGGKTAVDFAGIKNLIGAFYMPSQTVVSFDFCKTLSSRDMLCGIGEIVKTCLLTKASYAELIDKIDKLAEFDTETVYSLIKPCINIKKAVVTADAKETGLRKILNVGHTVGHALESLDGFKLSHGEYVLKGMMTECAMCKDLIAPDHYEELLGIFRRFTTPPRTTAKSVCECALKDKKNDGKTITVMLPTARGEITEVRIERGDFTERYTAALRELKTV